MLVRMLRNRLKKIEITGEDYNPNRIVIKNIGDLFNLYDKIAADETYLEKDVYFDLAFFKGDRKRWKEANESGDILYPWNLENWDLNSIPENDDDEFVNSKKEETNCAEYEKKNFDNTEDKKINPDTAEDEPQYKTEQNHEPEHKPLEEGNSSQEDSFVIPESVFQAGRNRLGGVPPCGSFD